MKAVNDQKPVHHKAQNTRHKKADCVCVCLCSFVLFLFLLGCSYTNTALSESGSESGT
jgi:hypothetical protein